MNGAASKETLTFIALRAQTLALEVHRHFASTGTCPNQLSDIQLEEGMNAYHAEPFGREWAFVCSANGAAVLSFGPDGEQNLGDVGGVYVHKDLAATPER